MITLDLNKGSGMLDLSKVAPSLKTIRGLLNWNVNPVHGASLTQGFDLDIFAFVLNDADKIDGGQDVVFYKNKDYMNGVITIPKDNRTGEGVDDENIDLILDKLPANKTKVDIYVFIFDAENRKQTFGMMADASFVLSDVEGKSDLVKYELSNYTNETALHVGRFAKTVDGWTFTPIGDVASADPNQVVQVYI